jgi:hypothetical protein
MTDPIMLFEGRPVTDRLPLIRERLSRSNPFSADRDDLLWALDEIERMRAASALTDESREVIRALIRTAQDFAFDLGDIPRERSLDRVEEEFMCVAKLLPVRKEWR